MRRVVILLVVVLLASASTVQAQSRDERAVRALLDKAIRTGNTVDENAIQALFADYARSGGPFYPPFGDPLNSAAEVEAFAGDLLKQVSARTYVATTPPRLRMDRNNAYATYTWHAEVTFKDGTRRSFDGRSTISFVKEGRNWKIAHWHSSLPSTLPPTASALAAETEAILQIVRNGWEAVRTKKLEGIAAFFADDASLFHDGQAYRLRGKQAIMQDFESWLAQTSIRSYQISDPQVRVLGDTAILTYYFTESRVTAGKEFAEGGKITVIFTKQDGTWRALHQHVSLNR